MESESIAKGRGNHFDCPKLRRGRAALGVNTGQADMTHGGEAGLSGQVHLY